jgi:uncharacterized protein YdeI (YjbR/CyaY-like superfamily)
MKTDSFQTKTFASAEKFRAWLDRNHHRVEGLWLRYFKKGSGKKSITYAEALDQALCFGWIDGQVKPFDADSWLQRFTPRRARSKWSWRNTQYVERLTAAGLMQPGGLATVEAAKADGRWAAAYPSPRQAEPPEDFLIELRKNPRAFAYFQTLNRANIYAIVYRLQPTAKPETRTRRLALILKMLGEGKAFHPQTTAKKKPAAGNPKA